MLQHIVNVGLCLYFPQARESSCCPPPRRCMECCLARWECLCKRNPDICGLFVPCQWTEFFVIANGRGRVYYGMFLSASSNAGTNKGNQSIHVRICHTTTPRRICPSSFQKGCLALIRQLGRWLVIGNAKRQEGDASFWFRISF